MSLVERNKPADRNLGRRERRRVLLVSVAVLIVSTSAVTAITMWVIYGFVFERARVHLQEVAVGRARLVEAVAKFDARHSADYPDGPEQATLSQLRSAQGNFPGFGETGEFTLGRREGNEIVFLLSLRHNGTVDRLSVPWSSTVAEPMRRALQGQSGTLVGEDYRGTEVFAAHEPVPGVNWGIVAKIDLAEIHASFVRAGLAAVGLGALVIALGVMMLFQAISPIIERLGRRTQELGLETEERARAERELAEARSLLVTAIGEAGVRSDRPQRTQMRAPPYFRAIALDYDGTLTTSGRPTENLLGALERARKAGLKLLLVTGRIMSELQQEFLDVNQWFDLMVAENGAVLYRQGVARTLASPVSSELDGALEGRRIPFRRGQVLVACEARYDHLVLEEISRLQLDCQIVRNRQAIMVLPAGISKGTGLAEGLDALGVSLHNTIAVGDAENDLSMFEQSELGVTVSNALPSLKAHADIVLDLSAGEGVRELLDSGLAHDHDLPEPKRWRLSLGHTPEGSPVTVSASPMNLLITGGSRSGKSFSSGLIAEQLIELGYSVCIFDPEGDHVGLGRLRDVFLVGGNEPLPAPHQLARIIQHRFGSVVVNLSLCSPEERDSYTTEALQVLKAQRALSGFPHWIVADEAQEAFATSVAARSIEASDRGYCLVTYRPRALLDSVLIPFDFVLAIPGGGHDEEVAETVGALTEVPPDALARFLQVGAQQGQALLIRVASREVEALTLAPRTLEHVRHRHKYSEGALPPDRQFFFRTPEGPNGAKAGNIEEFYQELMDTDRATLIHHAQGCDFSRWIEKVVQDEELAKEMRNIERRAGDATSTEDVAAIRREMLDAIGTRYLT